LPKELINVQKSNLSCNGPGPMPEGMKDGEIQYPVTFARKDKFEEILNNESTLISHFWKNNRSIQIRIGI
jgi:hypothetical protein